MPVATEQKRGLAKRVSLKQALAQQGFTGQSKRQTEWNAWVNSEKLVLEQIAQQHSFEVIHGDGGRPHMSLPEYKEAARELVDYQKINDCSKVTVDNVRRNISSFFSWLEEEDYILKSPMRRIHKIIPVSRMLR